jgi:ring-1,2-phenylacetyl-CoA epoxidase subunit PaaD
MENKAKYYWDLLEQVKDPEIPVLSIIDLGIVREVKLKEDIVEIVITPTYSGCPAMDFIEVNIKSLLQQAGKDEVQVTTVLHPAWTTDWISDSGKDKLRAYGIAPPAEKSSNKTVLFAETVTVPCPLCDSEDTEMISQFGSTACKSLFKCNTCKEPFDYFKCH